MSSDDGGTFVYQEFHFQCYRCELATVGVSIEDTHGHGWPSRREARAALRRHLKECDEVMKHPMGQR